MSKKKDPLTSVIQYFSTAPVDEAARTLTIVKEVLRHRASPLRQARDETAKALPAPSRRKPITGTLTAPLSDSGVKLSEAAGSLQELR